jgi:hypothetical protein
MGDRDFRSRACTPIEAIGISQIDVFAARRRFFTDPAQSVESYHHRYRSHCVGSRRFGNGSDRRKYGEWLMPATSITFTVRAMGFRVSVGGLRAENTRFPRATTLTPTGAVFNLDRMPQTFDHSGEAGLGYGYQGDFGAFGIGGST